MAKKFFYNRVYNTKRTIINAIIIGVCVIGVIVCFILVSNFEGEEHVNPGGDLSIKSEVIVEVNEQFNKEIFFSEIDNVNMDEIEINYALDYDITKVGDYEVSIKVNDKSYPLILKVVDTTRPDLAVKDVKINKNGTYSVSDFVVSCSDNSNLDCDISFYKDGIDEDGNLIDYSKYKDEGTYQIKILAVDNSGNQTIKDAILTIGNPDGENNNGDGNSNTETVDCKYGDNSYDTKTYLLTVDVTTNKCAISLDLYKDEKVAADINKIRDSESTKIQKDVAALNLKGTPALNRKITAVVNTSGSGVVGYELQMTVTVTNDGKTETVAEYKVDSNGKRIFTTNPYNLAS